MSAPSTTRRPTARKAPWYAEGVRFACLPDCGRCCTRHGDYDYVYLVDGDVESLAAALGETPDAFLARWTRKDDGHVVLRMDGPACPFLQGTRCAVYDARPSQCRTFPFWKENLRSRDHWERLRSFCPGIGEGEILPLHVIRDRMDGGETP